MEQISLKDTNPEYWQEYTNLQHVKHALIEHYLNGWLPMLGSWSGRVLYFDTHAGRGKHVRGQCGSPLVAMRTLLNHKYRESVFNKCEVVFFFIETDDNNCRSLQSEINNLGELPAQLKYEIICGDCFESLESLIGGMKASGNKLAPAFIFVDPYGFKIPGAILRELMSFDRVELFINVIWRELSMAIAQGESKTGMAETLNLVFNGDEWRQLVGLDFDTQADACINLMRTKIDAKWATYIRMLGKNRATRYMLLHLTNHDAGRDLMKECVWKVCPEGSFYARATDNPAQQYLISPSPDLAPLKKWIMDKLSRGPIRWQDLIIELRAEIWRTPQLNDMIRELKRSKVIDGRDYSERFVPKRNPELFLTEKQTGKNEISN